MELRGFRDTGLASPVVLCAALAALTLLRLVMAGVMPLAPDEAYYWVWSRALAPGYPDHPPMVALWIRAGTWLAGDGPLGVRLLGPLSVAMASVLLVDAGERLLPGRRAGLVAAALLNASLLFGIGAVVMTPDTPLLFFWTCCLWALGRVAGDTQRTVQWPWVLAFARMTDWWWLAVGLFAGLALASKYTAVFLWFGIALWLLATPERRRPAPWVGALLGLAVFAPVVVWEATHGWPSFARQGGRLGEFHLGNALRFLSEFILGQVGLATPLVFMLCGAGIIFALRQGWTLLAALTVPAVLVFTAHAFGDRVQGNWPAIIYPAAAIAAGGLTARGWRRLYAPAVALGLAMTLLVYAQASWRIVPLPPGVIDPIELRLAGWHRLANEVEAARQQAGASFVASDQYGVAAELARELPTDDAVVGIDPRWETLDLPAASLADRVGLLVTNGQPAKWTHAAEIGTVVRSVDTFRIYQVTGPAQPVHAVLLPRPGRVAAYP